MCRTSLTQLGAGKIGKIASFAKGVATLQQRQIGQAGQGDIIPIIQALLEFDKERQA